MNKEKIINELLPQLLDQGCCDGNIEDHLLFALKPGNYFGVWGGNLVVIDIEEKKDGSFTSITGIHLKTDTNIPSINNEIILNVDDNGGRYWMIPKEYIIYE